MSCGDPMPGCTCGPYWSVVAPGPCPHHPPLFYGYSFVPVATPWCCPRCQRMNAPHANQCDCLPSSNVTITTVTSTGDV